MLVWRNYTPQELQESAAFPSPVKGWRATPIGSLEFNIEHFNEEDVEPGTEFQVYTFDLYTGEGRTIGLYPTLEEAQRVSNVLASRIS